MSNNKIEILRLLQNITSVFSLTPPYEIKDDKVRQFKLLCLSWMSVVVIVTVYIFYKTIVANVPAFLFWFSVIRLVLCTGTPFTAMLSAFKNLPDYNTITIMFKELDQVLQSRKPYISSKVTRFEVVGMHVFFIILLLCHYLVDAKNVHIGIEYVFSRFQSYAMLVLATLLSNYLLFVKHRFGQMNIQLDTLIRNYLADKVFFKYRDHHTETEDELIMKIVSTARTYTVLNEIGDLLNKTFGWPILFIFGSMGINFLGVVDYIIMYFHKPEENYMSPLQFTMIVSWAVLYVVMGIIIAVTCDATAKEAKKTAIICYDLLLEVPATSNNLHYQILREELIILTKQSTYQYPQFSAAGFFTIDYTMLFGLFGSVTSYVILLLQINT